MTQLRRVLLAFAMIFEVLIFIVFLVNVIAPFFNVADGMAVASGPWAPALNMIRNVAFGLIVPIFLITAYAYLMLGPAQEEAQRHRYRI